MSIDIRRLKRFVRDNYPPFHPLQIIHKEPDKINTVDEYIAKMQIWLQLGEL